MSDVDGKFKVKKKKSSGKLVKMSANSYEILKITETVETDLVN